MIFPLHSTILHLLLVHVVVRTVPLQLQQPDLQEMSGRGGRYENAVSESVAEEQQKELKQSHNEELYVVRHSHLVIIEADTVVDPGTVVVEYLYAVITDAAVRTAGRTIELTGDAPFHSDLDSTNVRTPSLPAEC